MTDKEMLQNLARLVRAELEPQGMVQNLSGGLWVTDIYRVTLGSLDWEGATPSKIHRLLFCYSVYGGNVRLIGHDPAAQ